MIVLLNKLLRLGLLDVPDWDIRDAVYVVLKIGFKLSGSVKVTSLGRDVSLATGRLKITWGECTTIKPGTLWADAGDTLTALRKVTPRTDIKLQSTNP